MTTRRQAVIAISAAVIVPLVSLAQQPARTRRVGFFYFGSRKTALDSGRLDAFLRELRSLGYVPGTNLIVEERYADSNPAQVSALASELVRQKPDVIVATGGPIYRALVNATRQIPIVVTVGVDPVAAGYAATMARPGGNVTGLTDTAEFLGPKLLEFLLTIVPRLSRFAVLLNPATPEHGNQFVRLTLEAQKAGKQILLIEASAANDLDAGFAAMARDRVNGLIILADTFFTDQLGSIADRAIRSRLPALHANPAFAQSGGLLSYGFDLVQNFRRAAAFVDKILKGANPAEMAFEQPTSFELIINQKTAKALGIKIPQSVLLQATKVIE